MLPRDGPFIKPLLSITKEELTRYLVDRNLEWFEDASNSKRIYKRNRIRLDVLPLLEQEFGGESAMRR